MTGPGTCYSRRPVSAAPIDLAAPIRIGQPVVRVRYEYADAGAPCTDVAASGLGAGPTRFLQSISPLLFLGSKDGRRKTA